MIKGLESIILFSQSAKKLADFYRNKVGLKATTEGVMGENDEFYGFEFGKGKTALYVADHSEIKGQAKDPKRVIFNLEVDNIDKEVSRLKKKGVTLIADKYHLESYGYIATFADSDGNYFQFVQVKPG